MARYLIGFSRGAYTVRGWRPYMRQWASHKDRLGTSQLVHGCLVAPDSDLGPMISNATGRCSICVLFAICGYRSMCKHVRLGLWSVQLAFLRRSDCRSLHKAGFHTLTSLSFQAPQRVPRHCVDERRKDLKPVLWGNLQQPPD